MKPASFAYTRASGVDEAVALLADGRARPCSGTQSLGPMLNLRLAQPEALVDVSSIEALQAISLDNDRLVVGAAVTHARIEDDVEGIFARETRALLPTVAAGIAYRAIRQRGTQGGSLAHADPAADWVNTACLMEAGIRTSRGRRETAARFFQGPFTTTLADDELIVAVDWPRLGTHARWAYRKACRKPGEFAKALVAAWVEPARGVSRLLFGALAGAPHVVEGADAMEGLRGRAAQTALFDELGLDDLYQRQLLAVLLRRVLADLDPS